MQEQLVPNSYSENMTGVNIKEAAKAGVGELLGVVVIQVVFKPRDWIRSPRE